MRVEKEQTNLKQVEYKIVHTFGSLFRFVVIYHFCEHYHYYYLQVFVQFYILEKRWIFIENANSLLLTLVLCSSLI